MRNHRTVFLALLALASPSLLVGGPATTDDTFRYQGHLEVSGAAANQPHDFVFSLWDAESGGTQLGPTLEFDAAGMGTVPLADGRFTVELNFGAVIAGDALWLEIAVRPEDPSDTAPHTTLSPRQRLRPAANALHAPDAGDAASVGGVTADDLMLRSVYDTGSNGIVDTADNVDDADPSPTNELTVSMSFNTATAELEIVDPAGPGGNQTLTTKISSLAASDGDPAPALLVDEAGDVFFYPPNASDTRTGLTQNPGNLLLSAGSMAFTAEDSDGDLAVRLGISGGADDAVIGLFDQESGNEFPYVGFHGSSGRIGILNISPDHAVETGGEIDVRGLEVYNGTLNELRGAVDVASGDAGRIQTRGPAGNVIAEMGSRGTGAAANDGHIRIYDDAGTSVADLFVSAAGAGALDTDPATGNGDLDIGLNSSGVGTLTMNGPGGNSNLVIGQLTGNPDRGGIFIRDSSGTERAAMFVRDDDTGRIYADSKNFVIDHPTEPGMKLVHTCEESPEHSVYYRGTATIENGAVTVSLPEYFEALTLPGGRTISLTCVGGFVPLYLEGEIADGSFTVASTSSARQDFHWEVRAERADIARLDVEYPSGPVGTAGNIHAEND